jgi:iron-regulated transporter 1
LALGVLPVVLQQGSGSGSSSNRGQQVVLLLMLCGLVLSRMGLWLFDLAVSQMQQDTTAADELGEGWE